MRRLLTAICGLSAIGVLSAILLMQSEPRSFAQQPTPFVNKPDIVFAENPAQAAADETIFKITENVEPTAFASFQETPTMRAEFQKLLSRKAELMKDDELATAFDRLQTEVTELEAGRKLEQIAAELQALIGSHPDTVAARRAQAMLNPPILVEDMYSKASAEAAAASAEAELQPIDSATEDPIAAEPAPIDPHQPAFIGFNELVVNLDEERLNRYLDVELTLQVVQSRHDEVSARLEAQHAILQSWLLGHLSSQKLDGIRGAAGQERLRTEIKDQFNAVLFSGEDAAINDVLFQKFTVQ